MSYDDDHSWFTWWWNNNLVYILFTCWAAHILSGLTCSPAHQYSISIFFFCFHPALIGFLQFHQTDASKLTHLMIINKKILQYFSNKKESTFVIKSWPTYFWKSCPNILCRENVESNIFVKMFQHFFHLPSSPPAPAPAPATLLLGHRWVIQPVRLAGDWWLMLLCSERRVLLAGCWWLVCSERKVLLAGGW
jgi:hypothetical protein